MFERIKNKINKNEVPLDQYLSCKVVYTLYKIIKHTEFTAFKTVQARLGKKMLSEGKIYVYINIIIRYCIS